MSIFIILTFKNPTPMPYRSFIIDCLKEYGISTEIFLAGMSGAIVFLTSSKQMTHTQRFLTTLSGGLSANYLTPIVAVWFNLDPSVLYGIAFLLGYSGMKSVELILRIFQNRISLKQSEEQNRNKDND